MCGVAGIVSLGEADRARVRRMCDVMAHRGPDGVGYHDAENVSMGMRRLAILDPVGGNQPTYNEDGTVVAVFNGELYNFPELREQLLARGHRLSGRGDSECLVHLYEEFGDDLVYHLRGMFAFAIWDAMRQRLLLARDRVGKKPLYWRDDGTSLSFASELKGLVVDPQDRREVDPVALHHYLTYQYVPAPWSIYQGINKLPPGSRLVWRAGTLSEDRYWSLDFTPRPAAGERDEAARLRDLLLEATRVRMVADRPVGAFLSGGIDSSAVVAAIARAGGVERIHTFCVGFEDERFDERSHARAVARLYGTDHHELVVTAEMLDVLPMLAWHFDEPFADSSAIPSYFVARLSSAYSTVVLNGDGGDECFGGYLRYSVMDRAGRIKLPAPIRASCGAVGGMLLQRAPDRHTARRVGHALRHLSVNRADQRYARLMSYFRPEQKYAIYSDVMREAVAAVDSDELVLALFGASNADSDAGRAMEADVNSYLPGDLLAKVDITTMANSIEARSPFLDHNLMQWAAGLPTRFKVRGGETKRLLRSAVHSWLPEELVDRPKKGFGVPMAQWLRGDLRELARDVLTDHTARSRGYFRPQAVAGLLARHDAGEDHAVRIWALIQLELWQRVCVDACGAAAALHRAADCAANESR